jgi:hypothetical protein
LPFVLQREQCWKHANQKEQRGHVNQAPKHKQGVRNIIDNSFEAYSSKLFINENNDDLGHLKDDL